VTEPLDAVEEADRPRTAAHSPVRVRVPAKINLHLGVGPLRADGYHEVTTVYQAISLYDEVTARPGDTLVLTMEGEGAGDLPLDDSNLVVRAVRALARYTGRPPHARLHLRKQIPVAGGLAGGSADAAAALVACDTLWGTHIARDELAELAAELGSDVPFLVLGGTALGTGRGERISPVLATGHAWHWVVAVADGGLATPDVYRELDRMRSSGVVELANADTDRLLAALRQRDPDELGQVLCNDLQPAAVALRPSLADTLKAGHHEGALASLVSGSGPTCLFLAEDARHAAELADRIGERGGCRQVRVAHGPVPGARVM